MDFQKVTPKKIDMFLDNVLSRLGLNYANAGTRYIKEIVKIAFFTNVLDIKYQDLILLLSKQENLTLEKISSNIYSAVHSINLQLAQKNFKDIFHMDFDHFFLTPKHLTVLLLNTLNRIYKN